jgi:uncharacterized protein (DUF1778 family)
VERQIATITQAPRNRDKRLEARVTPGQKKLIERAAQVQGRTVTDFVITSLQDAARKAIEENTVWKLSQDQQKIFVEALMDPPPPNRKLRAAFRRHEEFKSLSNPRR